MRVKVFMAPPEINDIYDPSQVDVFVGQSYDYDEAPAICVESRYVDQRTVELTLETDPSNVEAT